jgi:hypothetical protein
VKAAALCLSITISCAQSALAQTQGHTLLFHPDSTTILEADQRAIFESLEYVVSADGTSLEVVDCGPIFAQATETDLNGDGLVEVFVLGGNTCTSGMDGSTITLWIKNGDGSYAMNLGFPAGGWTVLETANMGTPICRSAAPGSARRCGAGTARAISSMALARPRREGVTASADTCADNS